MAGLAQPTITTQPKNQSVSLGAKVTFSVKATGTAPLNYQWRFNGGEIAGAVTNALSLTNVSVSAAGEYLAVVGDFSGLSSTSSVATLSVDPTFTKITAGAIVTDREFSFACAWEDYDRDGVLDLLVGNGGILAADGPGRRIRFTTTTRTEPSRRSPSEAWSTISIRRSA